MSSWWLLLIAAPGMWLAFQLYLRKDAPGLPARNVRYVLALLTGIAWLLLALFAVAPRFSSRPEIWHPPAVVLALDVSPSYSAAGLRDSAIATMRAARLHYEAQGFRVVETAFAERVTRSLALDAGAGTLSMLSSLRRHLDTAAPPHLQAVFLWTDGRFHDGADEEAASSFRSAPVYPVMQQVDVGEVQGESATMDFTAPGGATLAVTWRSLNTSASHGAARARDATLELYAGERLLWKTTLPHPLAVRAGDALTTRLPIPAHVQAQVPAQGAESTERAGEKSWVLLLRPDKQFAGGTNVTGKNDTVPITLRTRNQPLHIFFRPVASLEDRGLLDALRASDDWGLSVIPAEAWRESRRDVIWIPAAVRLQQGARITTAKKRALEVGVPAVVYEFSFPGQAAGEDASKLSTSFGPDARLEWQPEGTEFLPAGALRLADLGMADVALRAPDSALVPLAWVTQNNQRGLLFWRHHDDGTYGFVSPPLWRTGFVSGVRNQSGDWVRGIAAWVMTRGGARAMVSDTAHARVPLDIEMARLGIDAEALDNLAVRLDGKRINISGNDFDNKISWPELPDGQLRESRVRSLALTPPFATALLIAIALSCVWVLRRRLRLD